MMRLGIVLAGALALTACDGGRDGAVESKDLQYVVAEEAAPAPAPPMMERTSGANKASANPDFDDLPQRAGLFLAYTHSRTITAPVDSLKPLLDAHTERCREAGPRQCIVTNSGLNGLNTDYANGYLNLKAAPDWAETFLGGLPAALKSDNAVISDASTSAIDLTSQIIDADARLKAQITLRDRLQALLENREGNLEELLGVERELARVQGDIDAYESTLANLKQRVSMSTMNLYYEAKRSAVSESVWDPLMDSLGDFFRNISLALGFIVTLFAFLLPGIPFILLVIWATRLLWRRLRKPKTPATES